MTFSKLRYRLYEFGTIILPDEVRRSNYCSVRVSILTARLPFFASFERIPPQGSWGYVVLLDADGYALERELEIRFARQRWVLWEYPEDQITQNLCGLGNALYEDILVELAKKPNIPPLPPSLPPAPGGAFQNSPRLVAHGIESFTVRSRFKSDMDVEIWYTVQPVTDCTPEAVDPLPGSPPLQPALPSPGGPNGAAPPPTALVPVEEDLPPLGGGAAIPPGFPPGYQSSPPSLPQFKKVTVLWEGVNPCNKPCSERAIVRSFFYVSYGEGTNNFFVTLGTAPAPCSSVLGFTLNRVTEGGTSVVGTGPVTGIFSASVVSVENYSGPTAPEFEVVFNPCV